MGRLIQKLWLWVSQQLVLRLDAGLGLREVSLKGVEEKNHPANLLTHWKERGTDLIPSQESRLLGRCREGGLMAIWPSDPCLGNLAASQANIDGEFALREVALGGHDLTRNAASILGA